MHEPEKNHFNQADEVLERSVRIQIQQSGGRDQQRETRPPTVQKGRQTRQRTDRNAEGESVNLFTISDNGCLSPSEQMGFSW